MMDLKIFHKGVHRWKYYQTQDLDSAKSYINIDNYTKICTVWKKKQEKRKKEKKNSHLSLRQL
jgi:hypothetical protein